MTQPSPHTAAPPLPSRRRPRAALARVGALAGALAVVASACSAGRLDENEARAAAERARQLYPDAFRQRAPSVTDTLLAQQLRARVDSLDPAAPPPALAPEDFDLASPRFATASGPVAPAVKAVRDLCAALPAHNLNPALYPCPNFDRAIDALQAHLAAIDAALSRALLTDDQAQRVRTHLTKLDPALVRQPDGSVSDATLLALLFGDRADLLPSPTPQIGIDLQQLQRDAEHAALEAARAEVLGHELLAQLAWDLGALHAARHWADTNEHNTFLQRLASREERATGKRQPGMWPHIPPDWPKTAPDAQRQALRAKLAALRTLPVPDAIQTFAPRGDQYPRLLRALARYRGVVSSGGFIDLPDDAKNLKPGRRSPSNDLLRRRLAQEGYDVGPPPASPEAKERFDDRLKAALRAFQRAHQLRDRAALDKDTLRALAVPAEEKLHRVQLALQRWREAHPRQDYHVYINIPDFHGEVWKDAQRVHRFRIVVGNTKRGSKRGVEGRVLVNATPRMHASIDRVILNPYWNVPSRIFRTEILNQELKDMDPDSREDALKRKGFELMSAGSRSEWVRMPPGPGNALGRVKIIFPNPHETYLHDTPSKSLFQRPHRAYSHGCMRVHNPLDLARVILKYDGQYDADHFDRVLRGFDNTPIFLNTKVPIHVDYITVRVDDDGVAHFLDDLYGYDAPRLQLLAQSPAPSASPQPSAP